MITHEQAVICICERENAEVPSRKYQDVQKPPDGILGIMIVAP